MPMENAIEMQLKTNSLAMDTSQSSTNEGNPKK
jgi:hypothetical protein